jgi:hypothetical protein
MLNDPLILDSAQAMARNILHQHTTPDERIRAVYLQTLGRYPRTKELERDTHLLNALSTRTTEKQTWMLYCQSLFASNGFFYLK